MIPAFHDYSLEPKITKCGDLLYEQKESKNLKVAGNCPNILFTLVARNLFIYVYVPSLCKEFFVMCHNLEHSNQNVSKIPNGLNFSVLFNRFKQIYMEKFKLLSG